MLSEIFERLTLRPLVREVLEVTQPRRVLLPINVLNR